MIQPDPQVIRAFAHIAQNVPAVKDFIRAQCKLEVDRLPLATNNQAVAAGRCQVLQEIDKLLQNAPQLAAQSNG